MHSISRYASLLSVVILFSSCSASVTDAAAPSMAMLGEWSYASPRAPRESPTLNTGLRVQIRIDSLDGMRFSGHVTLWFAGDVGVSPTAFGRVSGTVDASNGVTLVIPREPSNGRPLMVTGEVAGDMLTVRACHAGTEPGPFAAGSAFRRLPSEGPNQ